jgi:hypothetical protein
MPKLLTRMNSLDSILTQKINLVDERFLDQQEHARLLTKTPKSLTLYHY